MSTESNFVTLLSLSKEDNGVGPVISVQFRHADLAAGQNPPPVALFLGEMDRATFRQMQAEAQAVGSDDIGTPVALARLKKFGLAPHNDVARSWVAENDKASEGAGTFALEV
jgi:hypothetical protein